MCTTVIVFQDALKYDLSAREVEVEKLRKRLNEQLESDMNSKQQLQQQREEISMRTAENNRQRLAMEELERTCEKLRDEMKSRPSTDDVPELEAQISKYKLKLRQAEEDIESAMQALKTQREEASATRSDNSELRSKLHAEMNKSHDVALLLAASKSDKESLDIALKRLQADNNSLRSELHAAEDRNAIVDKELIRSRRELVSIIKRIICVMFYRMLQRQICLCVKQKLRSFVSACTVNYKNLLMWRARSS